MANKVVTKKQEPVYVIKWEDNAYARIVNGRIDLLIAGYPKKKLSDAISDDPEGFVEFARAIGSCLKGE
ncbi:hypothetical protein LCGC14_2293510 [marine sediment metagenome]|uniref:Uncharacterized protein n=1 Tax=marine sediment metagenome TaxID=412755 RepID=A0A0F9CQI4_9ZZZZ